MPKEEHLRIASNGGNKNAENMRCAEILKRLVNEVYKDKKGKKETGREKLMRTLFNRGSKNGKVDAIKLILQLLGEMPKTESSIVNGEKDNGMLEELLKANLEIQKKAMGEKENGQTGTESADANS